MANQGKIQFGVGFNVDKSGLNQLKAELQSLQSLSEKDLIKIGSTDAINDLQKIKDTAHQVEQALEKSFNPKLNTTDLTKFRTELKNTGLNISSIKASFDKAGQSGQNAFRNLTTELLTTNKHLKESSQLVQKMADTLSNTVRWSIASSALNAMTGQVQKAWSFTKQLDSSLNNIRIVTGKSADEMDRFAVQATKAAQALGASTKSYADAALIYYQQGLAEQDVYARAAVTTKVANVTGQSAATVSENLTAVWNGYKVSAAEAELYIDKLSAVAATTAADLEELSVGMSRVASAANIMGVDIDSLNAQLATIVSVTREAPESIGTALKTVYARMSDIESGLDAETTLGEYTQQMKDMGINVLDATGNLRDMDSVIEEIGNNWNKLSRNQQVSLAQTIAGTRQYSRMMALFDNWDMYQSAKRTSETGAGELQKQQDIYLDSTEAHLKKLQAETEELYQTLMDPKGLNPLIDRLTGLVGLVENFTEALGGGAGALHTFGAIGLNVFNKQITQGITRTVSNISGEFENRQRDISQQALINEYGFLTDGGKVDERTEKLIDAARKRYKVLDAMSEEEKQQSKELIKQTNEYYKQQDVLKAQKAVIDDIAQRYADMEDTSDAKEVTKAIGESVGEIKRQTVDASDLASLKEVGTTQHAVATKKIRVATAHDAMQTAYDDGDEEHFDKYYDEWATQIEELTSKQEEATSAAEKQKHAIANVVTVINESTVGTMANAEQQEKLEKITQAVNKAYDQNGNIIADTEKEIEEANAAVEEYNKLLEEMAKEGIEVGKSVKKVNADLVDNKKRVEEAEAALEKAKKNFDLTKNINQIVKLGGGLANIGSSIATIQNLGSIWNNDDLTTGEKVLQTIINMTTALSMMASGISTVKESFSFFKSIPKLFDELKKARAAAATANVAANVAETGSEVGLEEQIEETNKDKAARVALNKAQSNSSGDVTKSNIAEGVSENADDLAGKEGGKKLSKKGGKWIAKQAGKSGVRVAGGAIAGAVAAAAVSLAIFDYVANAEKRAMESAQEAANAMQETLSAVTASYDKLNSSISNLDNAIETLEGLTEGTVEWKQALHDVNSQVLELLREYPELNQYISRDSNGQLVVEKEGLDLIQEKQLAAVQKTQAALLIAQAKADRENINYLEEEWADAANNSDAARAAVVGTAAVGGAAAGAVGAAKIGGAVGTAISPGVGTAIGVAAGAVIGGVVGAAVGGIGTAITEAAEMDNISENEDFKAAFEVYKIAGAGIFDSNEALAKALNKDVTALSGVEKALVANKDATIDLCNAMLNAQGYESWVQIGEGILGADASEGAKALAGKEVAESDLVSYDEVKSQYGGFNDADERAIKKLLELSGMGTYVGVTGANKVQYRDKNTGEVIDKDIDWVYKQLQYYLSIEKAKKKESEYEAQSAKISNLFTGDEAKQAVQKLVTNSQLDLTKLTKSQYEQLVSESKEAMKALSDKQDKLLQSGINQYSEAWNKVITSLPIEIRGSFQNAIRNLDLNVDQLEDAATLYNQLFNALGDKGTTTFANISDALGDNFGTFIEQIQNTQLDSGNIEEQLRDILDGLKVDDVDAKVLREFAYALEYVTDVGRGSLEAMQKHYKDIYITSLNLKQFDTVSAEFYDKLSSGQREYFQLMADGTYQLIKDAKAFYALTQAEQYESNKNAIEESLAYQKNLTAEIDSLERDFADINEDIASNKQWTSNKANLDKVYTAIVYAPLQEKVKQIDTTVSVTDPIDSSAYGKIVDVPLTTLLQGVTQEEYDALQIGDTLNGYKLDSATFGMFNRHAYEVQDILALTEAGAQEAVLAWEESYVNRILNPLYAEQDRISSELATNKDKLSQLQEDLPELVTQLFGSLFTFEQYEQSLSQWSYLSPDETMLQNNLLRIAANQYDFKASDDFYLSKEALDDYIGEENLANVSDYQTLLAELALGFDLVDKRQEEAARSLKKYQTIFNELADSDKEEKLKNFDQQLGAIGQSFAANQNKLNAYSTQDGSLQKQIAANLADVGFVDEDGNALGVDSIFTENGDIDLATYEALKQAYANKDFSSEAEAERAKQTLESVEKYMADKNAVEDAIEQDVANFYDTNAQKFDFELSFHLNKNDAKKEYLNFKREFEDYLDEESFTVGGSYLSEAILASNNIDIITQGIDELNRKKEAKDITAALYEEEMQKLNDLYYSDMTNMKAALESYEQERLEAIENISDAYEKQIEALEDINSMLEHQKQLTELIYGEGAAAHLKEYYAATLTNAQQIEAANKSAYDYWKKEYEDAIARGDQDDIDAHYAKMNESAKAWAESITNTLQVAQDTFLNNMTASLDTFDQAISNGRGMEALKEEWDWTTEQQNKYLTSLNAVIEKEKLKNTFAKAIDNTSNIKAQQAINKLLSDELTILNSLDKISQKDIERAEKKLSILQAEIALQEAQDAKTQMRLVRGADGTYGYEYTADETKITEAQEKVLAANQELYNFDSERYQGTLDEWYSLYSEYQTKMQEAWADGTLSADEEAMLNARKERLTELASEALQQEENLRKTVEDTAETFGIKASEVSGEINTMFNTGLAAVVKSFVQDKDGVDAKFKELTGSIKSEADKFTTIASTQKDALDSLFYGEKGEGGILGAYTALAKAQDEEIQRHKDEKDALDNLWGSYQTLAEKLGGVVTKYSELNAELDKIPDLSADVKAFDSSATSVQGLATAVNNYVQARRDAAQAEGYSFDEQDHILWDEERNENALNLSLGTSDNSIIEPAKSYGSAEEELRAYIQEYSQGNYGAFGMDSRRLSGLYSQMVTEMTPVTPEGEKKTAAGQSSAQDAMRDAFDLITHGYAYTGVTTDMSTINSEWEGFGDNVKIKINDTDYEVEFPHASKNVVGPELQGILSNIYQNPTNGSIAAYNNTPYMYIDKHWFKIEDSNGNFAKAFMQHLRTPHFKTGGLADFTGPAWLDGTMERPELVLNQNDTSNFLDALQILRSLNLSMLQNISGLSNISARFGGATFGTAPIEQTIHITAEFPDATDAEEIKEAFNELVNLATQKALENRN